MRHLSICALLVLLGESHIHGQNQQADFNKPFPPHQVIGNVYNVGSEQLDVDRSEKTFQARLEEQQKAAAK